MKIVFADSLPEHGAGLCFHFHLAPNLNSSWQEGNAQNYIRSKEDVWLSQLEAWHIELSKKASAISSHWWLMAASRLVSWYPPIADKLFFAIAVIDIVEQRQAELAFVIGCPADSVDFLRELRPNWKFEFLQHPKNNGPKAKVISKRFQNLISWLWKTTRNTFRNWPNKQGADLIAYSHAMSGKNLKASGDHYFGKGLRGLSSRNGSPMRVLWLYLFVPNDGASKNEILNIVRANGDDAVFVDDAIGWPQAFYILRTLQNARAAGSRIREQASPLQIGRHLSHVFLTKWLDPQMTYYKPFTELMVQVSARRLLAAVKPEALIYPYEEKGLEHGLIDSVRKSPGKIQAIGFAHAVHNKGHMYMRARPTLSGIHPLPDVIGTTGPSTQEWLTTWGGHPASQIAMVGSPRYTESLPPPEMDKRIPQVLVIISSAHELPALASMVRAQPDIFDRWEVVIRRYPYGWKEEQDLATAQLKEYGVSLRDEGGPLKEQLAKVRAVIFCSSSAGLEAMLSARMTIYVNLNETMEMDPLTGKGDTSSILWAQEPKELKSALDQINSMTVEEYEHRAGLQRKFAIGIYSPTAFQKSFSSDVSAKSNKSNVKAVTTEDARI